MIADWCVGTKWLGVGHGAGQESWPQSVKDFACHAKKPTFDSGSI